MMNTNKTAQLMVEAYLKSDLSITDAIKEMRQAEKAEQRKKEREGFLANLLFQYVPAAVFGVILFMLAANWL